ncbi:MAG: SDR family NAD(P)-dependent oxidoreductase [Pseudomonadales bacterium]|nr:SDR family NAD(P)-dependent oxidoreductase [Pseudomonadales bacterium]
MDDLQGKVFIVTGANSGIGFEAAKNFASRGGEVVLVCRNETKGLAAMKEIEAETGSEKVVLEVADFSSLASVNELADRLLLNYECIDVLCNNAGGANSKRELTNEGFELTFATNHLSGFLLTQKLLPLLLNQAARGEARVVFTSSLGHKNSPLDFDDLNLDKKYSTLKAYGRSKLMNLLTAREIHRRYGHQAIIASSFHPGAVRTAIWGKGGFLATVLGFVMYPFMWSIEKGADTFIWLASSQEEAVKNAAGNYFFDRRQPSIADFATDEAAKRLWEVSEELIQPHLKDSQQI